MIKAIRFLMAGIHHPAKTGCVLEVSKAPEVSSQFRGSNKIHIRNGNSPFTREQDRAGGRERYEIHHIIPISKGGDVYNVDNMDITSPKRHIDIHSVRQSK
ncbi:HNH endonuclease signature motif containing protein [Mangrovibacter phragmitis]|uniref:HNH endonuclease signature motif containing protein n=1 Tax=Mangrovibacter phragmitis TaxID=1691903 RepID=UPI0035153CFA